MKPGHNSHNPLKHVVTASLSSVPQRWLLLRVLGDNNYELMTCVKEVWLAKEPSLFIGQNFNYCTVLSSNCKDEKDKTKKRSTSTNDKTYESEKYTTLTTNDEIK